MTPVAMMVGTRESSYGSVPRIKDTDAQARAREGETAP